MANKGHRHITTIKHIMFCILYMSDLFSSKHAVSYVKYNELIFISGVFQILSVSQRNNMIFPNVKDFHAFYAKDKRIFMECTTFYLFI